jgi:ABC-type multidrug transport system fused ATPase/permease subunit
MYRGDLRFNLKFAQPEAEDAVMFGAVKAADSWGFINGLPQKWEAPIARRGYNFSSGQRQRLSINRTLAQEPKILILDDSTSAMDASTEGRVQAAIPEFTHGITTLYVAQRISAVIELGNIVLLQNGEIVEMASHDELMAKQGFLLCPVHEPVQGRGASGMEKIAMDFVST